MKTERLEKLNCLISRVEYRHLNRVVASSLYTASPQHTHPFTISNLEYQRWPSAVSQNVNVTGCLPFPRHPFAKGTRPADCARVKSRHRRTRQDPKPHTAGPQRHRLAGYPFATPTPPGPIRTPSCMIRTLLDPFFSHIISQMPWRRGATPWTNLEFSCSCPTW